MNAKLAQVKAALTKNKAVLGVLGAAAVAALAWRARSDKPATATPRAATTTPSPAPLPGYFSSGYQTAGATGYDSSASDVYNAIQPQLEDVGARVDQLNDLFSRVSTPIPVPEQAPAGPSSLGYVAYVPDSGSGGAWFELFNDSSRRWVSAAEAKLTGIQPTVTLGDAEINAYSKPYAGK